VARLDTGIDARPDRTGSAAAAALGGRAAMASARLAYQHSEQVFSGARWVTRGRPALGRSGPDVGQGRGLS
jgi:transaldolase